ncbi:MAG: HD domain-containing phosphohydrolase [Acidobacteriota bacterium]|nr:HD domain-containing protein [Blastocatellia bacterium]MDW8411492.1 HD domain-containing phosphohydrolase [Acidobacteriota bacterium]
MSEVWAKLSYKKDGSQTSVSLNKTPFTIGRLSENNLVFEDPYVSRYHAEIIYEEKSKEYIFRDKNSSSGSYINGKKLERGGAKILQPGDRISLGRATGGPELTFEVGSNLSSPPAWPASQSAEITNLTEVDHRQTRYLNTSLLPRQMTDHASMVKLVGRLSALYDITNAILAIRDQQEMLAKLLDLVFDVLPAERGMLILASKENGKTKFVKKAYKHRSGAVQEEEPSWTIVNHVYEKNVAVLSLDARNEFQQEGLAYRPESIIFKVRSVMCAPISSPSGQVWGVCYVDNIASNKRFEKEELEFLLAVSRQAGVALENFYLVDEQRAMLESFISTLAASIDARDDLTAGHSARVAMYSKKIARYMGFSPEEQKLIYYAGLLHDYGKIGTREAVLCKPGKLTPEEMAHMREHARDTHRILSKIRFTKELKDIPQIASSHHEHMDGTGYPFGLRGEQIPIGGRIIAVADFFDALTQKRHYREPMPIEDVIRLIEDQTGNKFDVQVVAAFKRFVYEEYIPGQRRRAERDRQMKKTIQQPALKEDEPPASELPAASSAG